MKKRNILGFTMIELLIVIAILGILAAIVLPRFIGQDIVAKKKKVLSDLASLDAALQLYNMDNSDNGSGGWPSGATNLNFIVSGGYMAALPTPPASQSGFPVGASYSFKITSAGVSVYRGAVQYSGTWYDTSDYPLAPSGSYLGW